MEIYVIHILMEPGIFDSFFNIIHRFLSDMFHQILFPKGPVLISKDRAVKFCWSGPEGPQLARSVGTLLP